MFSSLGTKLALKKLGVPKDALSFATTTTTTPAAAGKRGTVLDGDSDDSAAPAWPPKWMSVKSLPLTAQAWLSPPPPPVPVAASCPQIGQRAPVDASGKLVLGSGRRVMVVFLRCVGCACKYIYIYIYTTYLKYKHTHTHTTPPHLPKKKTLITNPQPPVAQQTFLALRALSAKAQLTNTTFIAISHSSPAATQKWLDLIGGAWNVQVLIDEDRALYAAWGLGLSSVWYYFNPTTQGAAWREKGWLGSRVATSMGRGDGNGQGAAAAAASASASASAAVGVGGDVGLGNKWQQGGAWAIDGNGVVVWGARAERADEVMDLAAGFKALQG